MSSPPTMHSSAATSATDLTVLSPVAQLQEEKVKKDGKAGIFSEPGSIPLPDAGHLRLGVVFEDVTVLGSGGGRRTVEGIEVSMLRAFDVLSFIRKLTGLKSGPTRPLITNFTGVVNEGENLLVLGRPGAGCSTLLRALANHRAPFVRVEGEINYSSITSKEAEKYFQGEIVFNSEDDTHTPLLNVGQTLDVALSLKKPKNLLTSTKTSHYVADLTNRLLHTFGMPHVLKTFVGNEYIRGVSGGERKRVSLAEMLTTNAAVFCWDNSIRGLDSAVALHYLKALKELALSTGLSNIVSIYQASQEMYDKCFDKVVVIYEGELVFSGRTTDAEQYFIEQGWEKKARQTTPDFLTACTSVTERKVRDDYTGPVPSTPQEMALAFRQSRYFASLQAEIVDYKTRHAHSNDAELFRREVANSKHPLTGKANAYKANFLTQVLVLAKSQFQLQKADPRNFLIRIVSNILQATLVGALCYGAQDNAIGSYTVAGALFFAILYFVIFSFGEIPTTVMSRPLLIKHRTLGFYNPAAFVIANMVSDAPVYAIQTLVFSSIFYFIVGLNAGAKYFFTFWFIVFSAYMALSVMYRMIGSWSPNLSVAVRYGGFALGLVLTVAGFMLPSPNQHRWSSWMRRISVPAYALEALLANEFRTRTLTCSATDLIPNGPSYTDLAYQGCTIAGGIAGSDTVDGLHYLALKYDFHAGHIWRNVGIIWAMYCIYALFVVLGSSLIIKDNGGASSKVFKRNARIPAPRIHANVQEVQEKAEAEKSFDTAPVYTFKDVRYTVQVEGKDKVLLNGVSGFVEPGKLTALMGASGAGKTTLLDTIAQRKTSGKVEGEMLIDGRPLDSSFSRRSGFVMQGDIHESFSTVRECLQFSALLRQDASLSKEDKLAYAEEVIELLELGPIADALVGNPEIGGLGIEERKRLTIGVELAARPDFILFLDEPTSGLDSQAAYEIVRFLRKIAATGIALLCTIHQPSGDLFEMFDSVILLAPGGKTVYAGPTGDNANIVTGYFGRLGAVCPAEANPAEHIISTVAPVGGSSLDWPRYWNESDEAQNILNRISSFSARTSGTSKNAEGKVEAAFAAPYTVQVRELLKRNMLSALRDGPYYTTKLAIFIFFGLLVGFFNYHLPNSIAGMTGMSLSILTVVQASPPVSLDIAIVFQEKFSLFVARERNGIYSWTALVTALILVEIPILLVGYTIMFFCFFWTVGFGQQTSAEVGALTWLAWIVCGFFTATFGTLLGATSPTPFSIPFILSLVWNLFCGLSWALVSYPTLPSPFHYFFSWLSPLRWFFGAVMGGGVSQIVVKCTESELTRFNVPAGETCLSYASAFLSTAVGYLSNPNDTSNCGYCQYSTGADYMAQLGYSFDHKWRDWGIFIVFAIANVGSIFGVTWFTRIRPLYRG
ncbi:putative membrane protein of the ATP-binding cassette transporter superfamily [Meredithblackwellia eburnea MCA 4105]